MKLSNEFMKRLSLYVFFFRNYCPNKYWKCSTWVAHKEINSFHGVEEVNIEQKERNSLQLNYYLMKS